MATIINNPSGSNDSSVGLVIGIVIGLVLIALFFVYALPALRGNQPTKDANPIIKVEIPNPSPQPPSYPNNP